MLNRFVVIDVAAHVQNAPITRRECSLYSLRRREVSYPWIWLVCDDAGLDDGIQRSRKAMAFVAYVVLRAARWVMGFRIDALVRGCLGSGWCSVVLQ
jgi:hypothetical protein